MSGPSAPDDPQIAWEIQIKGGRWSLHAHCGSEVEGRAELARYRADHRRWSFRLVRVITTREVIAALPVEDNQ